MSANDAKPHIEELYRAHLFDYFNFKGKALPEWCNSLEFELKTLGNDIALHGVANYAIGALPGSGESTIIKARGHPLDINHYSETTGSIIYSPMKVMMSQRLIGGEMCIGGTSITYKPASVSDYKHRKSFRDRGGFPGFSIAKRTSVRLITYSEFNYPDRETRFKWKKHYANVTRKYNMGLEYRAKIPQGNTITVEQIELLKGDLQNLIWARKSPSECRVRRGKNVKDCSADIAEYEDAEFDDAVFDDTDAPETIDWESEGFTESVIEIPQYAS